MLTPQARPATLDDIGELVQLYRDLEAEMVDLKPIWGITDGLAEPVDRSLGELMSDDPSFGILMGMIDLVPVGFLAWHHAALLPQGRGAMGAVVDLIFTTADARRVGVGHAMVARFMEDASRSDIALFDAIVAPGHRHAKNFFESHGFKARSITMHRDSR